MCGRPMVLRVLDALQQSGVIDQIVLCGPPQAALKDCPELSERIANENIIWVKNQDSPSKSVEAGLLQINKNVPVLVTTADHALLTADIVQEFLQGSIAANVDATFALVSHERISKAFPAVKRTVIKFREGGYCSCNLFTFMTESGRKLAPFWRSVEQKRKKPWKVVTGILGVSAVVSYLFGTLTLKRVLQRVSSRLEIGLDAVLLSSPRAGVDVDTPADRAFAEKVLAETL